MSQGAPGFMGILINESRHYEQKCSRGIATQEQSPSEAGVPGSQDLLDVSRLFMLPHALP